MEKHNDMGIFEFPIYSGIINRGDSFRRKRSRSNSLAETPPPQHLSPLPSPEPSAYKVAMLGVPGVGKTALVSQFMTSECINAYDRQRGAVRCTKIHLARFIGQFQKTNMLTVLMQLTWYGDDHSNRGRDNRNHVFAVPISRFLASYLLKLTNIMYKIYSGASNGL
ncbi:unnamed protein product [Nesidiocoris tenuis]|uniref:Uncharacterized protein n=1 Tax=Nesidiocoris tenuis TaxID=355587 RepID=A0A6H5HH82_9HEMI|nr:unnamed protein product [Nesidiocoris tenuis]